MIRSVSGCLKSREIHPIYFQIQSINDFWSKEKITNLKRGEY